MIDLLALDRGPLRRLFAGADTVVHCGFAQPPPDLHSKAQIALNSAGGADLANSSVDSEVMFAAEHSNVLMAFNILQTAVEAQVRRVVMASSNHASDYHEELILAGRYDTIDPNDRALSDNYYGWAKIACESFLQCTPRNKHLHAN